MYDRDGSDISVELVAFPIQVHTVDLKEYKNHYNIVQMTGQLDILDLGYWNKDGSYEKAVEALRILK
jgi:hypothetical protein